MRTKTLRRIEARTARRGASLVEVLVVLVILLIGVFSVIRVFPVGFQGLRNAESRTLATRLATQLMEQIKGDDASLAQGVLFRTFTSSNGSLTPVINLTEDPDDLGTYDPDPNDGQEPPYNPYFSDVNKFRYIEGERVKIPLPTTTAYGNGSLYAVKFGPIYMDADVGDPENVPTSDAQLNRYNNFLRVSGAPLRGIVTEAEEGYGQMYRLRGPQTYLIDYGDDGSPAQILFSPRRPTSPSRTVPYRTFRVSFSYNDNGVIRAVPAIDLRVDDNDVGVWQPIKDAQGKTYQDLMDGSETVQREFTRLPASAPQWDRDDPYEYKLVSPNISATSGTSDVIYANMGVIAFNPAGATYSERTPFGQRALAAYIDYAVLDWHILREDLEVPSVFALANRSLRLKLTLNFIKRAGDAQPDQTLYQGLYNNSNAPVDIQVFDLQGSVPDPKNNGAPMPPGIPLYAGVPGDPQAHYWIDPDERSGTYRTGTIYVNEDLVPRGTQLRVLYKADGDWAVAIQKAYARYERAYDDGQWRTRPDGPGRFGREGTRLYFNRVDVNKSVVATFQYTRNDARTGNQDTLVRTPPVQLTIDEAGVEGTDDEGYAYVDLANALRQDIVGKYMPGIKDPNAWGVYGPMRGVSLKVRVIWKDNASTTNVWRIQDLNTYITPAES